MLQEKMRRLIISDKLYNYITEKLTEKYGQNVDPLITKRLEDEWDTICTKELESEYYNLAILISYIKEQGYSYMLPIGRTLMTYLMDTSSPNPLPPHKYCRECKKVFWCNDIIDKLDGFDIPFMEEIGINVLDDIELNCSCPCSKSELESDGHDFLWQIPLSPGFDSNVEIQVMLPKGTEGKVIDLFEDSKLNDSNGYSEISIGKMKISFCLDNKGPDGEYYNKKVDTSCIDYCLASWEKVIGIKDETDLPRPTTFSSLCAVYSLYHSTGIWDEKAKYMVEILGLMPDMLVCFQEDIYNIAYKHGYFPTDAYRILRSLRFGSKPPFMPYKMMWCEDAWKFYRLTEYNGPRYIFPKSSIVERIFYRLRENIF